MVLRDLVIDVYIWTGFIIWEKKSKKKKSVLHIVKYTFQMEALYETSPV